MVRWSGVAAVTGALVGACTGRADGEEGAQCEMDWEPQGPEAVPNLVANEMLDGRTIRLTFSEAMAPAGCVDPEKFRISAASGYVPDIYASYYADPMAWGAICPPTDEPEECCYYVCGGNGGCEEECIGDGPITTRAVELANDPGDDHSLLLTLNQDLGGYACAFAEYAADLEGYGGGLFVHYAPGDIPHVQSDSGGDLEAIAKHWVLSGKVNAIIQGSGLPHMDMPLPFKCP